MSHFPAALVAEDNSFTVFERAAPFVGLDGFEHPAEAWQLWTPADWETRCPGLRRVPLIDESRAEVGKRAVRLPEEFWTVEAGAVSVAYEWVGMSVEEETAIREVARNTRLLRINAERDRRLDLGALHQGKRFSMSDTSRTDLSGMATTAALVLAGALTWPDSYAQGWIALDNSRLPLPTPAEGIALAATVAATYSAVIQHARDLKDDALIATDPLNVDELAGWP